jgi:hypothetical protein
MFSSSEHTIFFGLFCGPFLCPWILYRDTGFIFLFLKYFIYLRSLSGYFLGLWAERKRLEEERVKEEQEYEEEKRRREEEKEKRKEAKAKVGDEKLPYQLHVSKELSSRTSMARKYCFGSGFIDSGSGSSILG